MKVDVFVAKMNNKSEYKYNKEKYKHMGGGRS